MIWLASGEVYCALLLFLPRSARRMTPCLLYTVYGLVCSSIFIFLSHSLSALNASSSLRVFPSTRRYSMEDLLSRRSSTIGSRVAKQRSCAFRNGQVHHLFIRCVRFSLKFALQVNKLFSAHLVIVQFLSNKKYLTHG